MQIRPIEATFSHVDDQTNVQTGGGTDRRDETVAIRDFANEPKKAISPQPVSSTTYNFEFYLNFC
jgi:hypothetical protein